MKKLTTSILLLSLLLCLIPSCGHEHTFGEWQATKEATCTESGLLTRLCECGEAETEIVPLTAHIEGSWITDTEPTCTEAGSRHRVCSVCSATTTTEAIPTSKHTPGNWITDTEPTCTEAGSRHQVCSICSASLTTESILKKGHIPGKWIVDKAATCTGAGSQHRICSVCSQTVKTESIAKKGHTYGHWVIDVEATCTGDGKKHQICATCGVTLNTATIPGGHAYASYRCTRCGHTSLTLNELGRIYTDKNGVEIKVYTFTVTEKGDTREYTITYTVQNSSTYNHILYPGNFMLYIKGKKCMPQTDTIDNVTDNSYPVFTHTWSVPKGDEVLILEYRPFTTLNPQLYSKDPIPQNFHWLPPELPQ